MGKSPNERMYRTMAKITIAGDAIVVTSAKTLEDIKTLEKYAPKALRLYETNDDGKKEEVFCVGSTTGDGSINQYGASFGSVTHDDEKLATITRSIPRGTVNAVEYAADVIGKAIIMLNKVEAQFDEALGQVAADKAAVLENITIA